MERGKLPEPIEVIRTDVPAREVGEYYLHSEVSRTIDDRAAEELAKKLPEWPEEGFWDLLAGVSLTLRHNWAFWEISNERYRWRQERNRIEDITLTGMGHGTEMTELIYSEEVNQDPGHLRKILESYLAGETEGLPGYLGRFKPKEIPKDRQIILVRERKGGLHVLDGMNRLIQHLANGETVVETYRALDQGPPDRRRTGDGLILQLRELYLATSDENTKRHIAATVEAIRKTAADGEKSVKRRWDEKGLPN